MNREPANVIVVNSPTPTYQRFDSKEPTMCCKLLTALKSVAIAEIAYLCFVSLGCVGQMMQGRFFGAIGSIAFVIWGFVAVAGLFTAAKNKTPHKITHYLIWKYVHMIFLVIAIGIGIYFAVNFSDSYSRTRETFHIVFTAVAVMASIFFILGIYYLCVAHKARTYLREIEFSTFNGVTLPQYAVPSNGVPAYAVPLPNAPMQAVPVYDPKLQPISEPNPPSYDEVVKH